MGNIMYAVIDLAILYLGIKVGINDAEAGRPCAIETPSNIYGEGYKLGYIARSAELVFGE